METGIAVGSYFYNPCSPCCESPCGWGTLFFNSSADISGFQQTNFSGSPTWSVAGFTLNLADGSGSLWKTTGYPDPTHSQPPGHAWTSGSATVQATHYNNPSSLSSGIFIGGGRVFYANWGQNQYYQSACDAHGALSGTATALNATPKTADKIALCIQALPDGKFAIAYSLNGKVIATETEVSLPILSTGSSFNSGFWGQTAAQFGVGSLSCGTSCPSQGCSFCNGDLAECWVLHAEGVSLTQFDGYFCLTASGCTITDPNHPNSYAVNIGQSQSTLFAGTSPNYAKYTLSGTFNCNGSNTFSFSSSTQGTGWPQTITITPTDCNSSPCVTISNCGGCSWPSRWTCTISGITTAGQCPMDPPFFPPNIPYSVPPDPPWAGDCNGPPDATCENVMNGTITLSGGTGPGGWAGGAANWSGDNGFHTHQLCNVSTDGGQVGLYCMTAGSLGVWGLPNFTDPTDYSIPGPGLLLLIRASGGPMAWWNGGTWTCGGPSYYVPYFCAFSQIACLQPVTLYQVPYTPGTFPLGTGLGGSPPPGVSQAPICSGFPGSITITPAP